MRARRGREETERERKREIEREREREGGKCAHGGVEKKQRGRSN